MKYPICKRLGLLRTTNQSSEVVSTTAMHDTLGWPLYKEFLPYMKQPPNGKAGLEPAHVEAWLRSVTDRIPEQSP